MPVFLVRLGVVKWGRDAAVAIKENGEFIEKIGGKMELLKLSKFKLQLRALITEVRELREREHSVTEQLNHLIQKQKQTEEEFNRKLQELESELASSNQMRQKLERKVYYLQNDNSLLENKQKELKGTIHNLLQSRENFINAYEDSTCEMKRSIETKDRKLAILSEKINTHLLLFDTIQKEAFSVKQVVDNVQHLVSGKEEAVAGLKSKMDKVFAFEKEFGGKMGELEGKLRNDENELRRKDKVIAELEAQLESAKISNNDRLQIEELQKALSAKEVVIQNLISEKKALHFEVGSLGFILQKVQDTVTNMNEKDKRIFSSVLGTQEECAMDRTDENYGHARIEDAVQHNREDSSFKASGRGAAEHTDGASPLCEEYNSSSIPSQENNNFKSCVSDIVYFVGQSACSEPQSASNVLNISVKGPKDICTGLVHQLDCESSTAEAETLEDGRQVFI